jgi:hypothetical protein
MMDIVVFVIEIMEGRFDGRPSFMETIHHTDAFETKKVADILHVFKFGPFVPLLEESSTLLDAALILGKHGLHRVCVVKEGGDIVNIITQSSLIRALAVELPAIKSVADRTLRELGMAVKPQLYAVGIDESVWSAVKVRLCVCVCVGALPLACYY